jgi:hypothetical protein
VDDQDTRVIGRLRTLRYLEKIRTVLADQYAIVRDRVSKDRVITGAGAENLHVDDALDVVAAGAKCIQKRMRATVFIEKQAHAAGEVRCDGVLRRLPLR